MHKITSKSSIRPELSAIYFAPNKMVATDSYRLIEVKKDIVFKGNPRPIKAKGFKGTKTVSIDDNDLIHDGDKLIQGERVDAEYPKYERVIPTGKPIFSIKVNAKYLAEIIAEADAQAGSDYNHTVRLDFYGEHRPMLITPITKEEKPRGDTKVRALLSPIT